MFDDFMEELRRRQADLEAADRKSNGGSDDTADGGPTNGSREDPRMRTGGPSSGDSDRDEDNPSPVFRKSPFGGGRRQSYGPTDGLPEIRIGRGWIILGVIAAVIVVLLIVFSLTVGLVTDAIWFQSVGYGNVFWTRLGTQILYFVAGAAIAFAVLWFTARRRSEGPR